MGICITTKSHLTKNGSSDPTNHKSNEFIVKNVVFNKNKITREYKILDSIGVGSFGQVRKAKHLKTQSFRAIKIINKNQFPYKDESKEQKAFLKEIEILGKLDHPNIIKTFEYFMDKKFIYIVTEFLKGEELFEKIKNQKQKHFTEKDAQEIFRQILEGVNYLHNQNIVHRDLKPENMMYLNQTSNNLKILDFGASKKFNPKKGMKNFHGTSYYIAPEILEEKYTEKCDVWSCGVILYILLSGRPPFNGINDEQILKAVKRGKFTFNFPEFNHISTQSKKLINQMLNKDPNNRPSISKCLQDPWFKLYENQDQKIVQQISQSFYKNLQEFQKVNIFQKTIYYFLVNQVVQDEEREKLMEIFKNLDENKDGVLSVEEIKKGMQKLFKQKEELQEEELKQQELKEQELEEMLKQVDNNNNGFIDYSEFVMIAMNRDDKIKNELNLKTCFQLLDQDKNGQITLDEFKELLTKNDNLNEQYWENLIKNVDKDCNKKIDFQEFTEIMSQLLPININQQQIQIQIFFKFENLIIFYCLFYDNQQNIMKDVQNDQGSLSSILLFSLKGFVLISTIIISTMTIAIFISLQKFNAVKKNRKKMIFLSISILLLTFCYGLSELIEISLFDKLELIFRDFLFFICFYFFFQDLLSINNRRFIFYLNFSFLLILQIISIQDLFSRMLSPDSCNLTKAQIQLAIHFILVLSFVIISNNWINKIINDYFTELNKLIRSSQSPQSMVFIDRQFLLNQLFKFKILIFVFFFSQLFKEVKTLFFILLNKQDNNLGDNVCLQLFGKDEQLVFYSFFQNEIQFFEYVKIGEHFFRIIFCFILPIIVVLFIMRAEKKHVEEVNIKSNSSEYNARDSGNDNIRGLYFKY